MSNLPTIAQLQAVEAAARHLSFLKAAQELHLTASAVSHRVRQFETLTNTILFHRDIRQIRITKAGREKILSIRKILTSIAALQPVQKSKPDTKPLKVAMPSLFFSQQVLPALNKFKSHHPDINLDIQVTLNNQLTKRYDAVVTFNKSRQEGWNCRKLLNATEVLVMYNRTTDKKSITAEANTAKIELSYAPKAWDRWLKQLPDNRQPQFPSITVNNMTEALSAAKAGLGVSITIKELIQNELKNKELSVIAENKNQESAFYLAINNNSKNQNLTGFSNWLVQLCAT